MSYQYATIDIETTGLNRYKDRITWIGVGLAKDVDSSLAKTLIYQGNDPESMMRFKRLTDKLKKYKVKFSKWQDARDVWAKVADMLKEILLELGVRR